MSQSFSNTTGQMAAIVLKSANSKIFRALLSIASAALLIRVMGMLNQVIVTARFGEGAAMDAYIVASTLPMILAQLITGSIEVSVIPVYTRIRTRGRKEEASRLFSTLLNLLLLGSTILTVCMILFHTSVIHLTAPALDPLRTEIAGNLALFIYPVLLFMVIIGFLESILNAEGQFGWPAYAGLLVPLVTALLVFTLGKSLGIVTLCVGMLLGLLLQLGVFILRVRQAGITYRPVLELRNPALRTVVIAAWPALLGAFISQISPLIDQVFASFLSTGSISAISYALKLISVPTGVIFISVGRAALPYLSRHAGINDLKGFKKTLHLYIWVVGFGTAILSIFMVVLAHPLVQLLFQRGAFSAADTNRTAITLSGFAIGLVPMSFIFILTRSFSALGKTRILLFIGIYNVITNAVFDFIFAHFWQSEGIALATSAMYFGGMFIEFALLRQILGPLNLLKPPVEVMNMLQKFFRFPLVSQILPRILLAVIVFAIGIYGIINNATYTLRISLGSGIVLLFLRYRYALLLTWVLLDVFIGSPLPFFNGNNFDTGLTVPTLLIMITLPLGQIFKRMVPLCLLFIYLLWIFASIGISNLSIGTFLTTWLLLLDYVAVCLLAITVITTHQQLMRFIDTMLLASLFVAGFGIYSYLTHQNGIIEPGTTIFRTFSVFGSAPTYGLFLSIVIPLAFYRLLTLRGFKQLLALGIVVTLLVALVFTFTRSAFITIPISIVVMALFLPSRKMKFSLLGCIAALGIIALLFASFGNVPIFDRFFSSDITTINGRTYLWQAVLEHFDPTQLLGNGLNASTILLTNLQVGYGGLIGTDVQNLYIAALYDHGVIGLGLLLVTLGALFINIIKGLLTTTGNRRMLFATALATFLSMFLQSFASTDLWISSVGIYFWLVMILPFVYHWSPQIPPLPLSQQPSAMENDIADEMTRPELVAVLPTYNWYEKEYAPEYHQQQHKQQFKGRLE
ncbi:MAG TPA: murein biosynthesis integral membrane protein MurJ [Ktedonobacteraceae bacterium]|nr:murein biosynthesis integral membrane protein MurJ [Ktedonobacteraceae bacterium]